MFTPLGIPKSHLPAYVNGVTEAQIGPNWGPGLLAASRLSLADQAMGYDVNHSGGAFMQVSPPSYAGRADDAMGIYPALLA